MHQVALFFTFLVFESYYFTCVIMCSSIEQMGLKSKSLSVIIRVKFGACCLVFRFDSFSFGKVTRKNECSVLFSLYALLLVLKANALII